MTSPENAGEIVREEVGELLSEMESALLELEHAPEDMALVNRVFRAIHTIKGAATMFGFQDAARLTHEVESLYDLVRGRILPAHAGVLEVSLKAKDLIGSLFSGPGRQENAEAVDAHIRSIREAAQGTSGPGILSESAAREATGEATPPAPLQGETGGRGLSRDAAEEVFHIAFRPIGPSALVHIDPLAVLDELRQLGRVELTPHLEDLPLLQELAPEDCALWWEATLTTSRGENAVRDVFLFVEDYSRVVVTPVAEAARRPPAMAGPAVMTAEEARPGREEESRPPGRLPSVPAVAGHGAKILTSIRVDAFKLDDLVALVGEMVIAQARLGQIAARLQDAALTGVVEDMDRLGASLRDRTLSLRMMPIGETFERFRRLVRDLSLSQGKEIDLVTLGAETELDKTVIEQLGESLAHLLRNSIDHGVEPPDEREAAGKPRRGSIVLAAEHAGGNVLIRVSDDGRGLDRAALAAKGVEQGLIADPEAMSDRDILDLAFLPGFSTAGRVTDISGRGVGMDAVKQSIKGLRGVVELASEPGRGTTVTVKLPLTLAIIEGLLVKVGRDHFVIPLAAVKECVELTGETRKEDHGKRIINLRGAIVPYVRLRDWFRIPGSNPAIEQIIITGEEGRFTGIVVDEVVGQQQTVIKSLGRVFRHVDEISGATIRGDGSMALILDLAQLLRKAQQESSAGGGGN